MFRVIRTSSLRALVREAQLSEERRRDLEEVRRELAALRRRAAETGGPQPQSAAAPGGAQGVPRVEGDGAAGGGGQRASSRPAPRPDGESRVARLALAPLVLVVEDDPETNRFVAEALSQTCRVVSASEGAEGVGRARELLPDLVVCGVTVPGMSGEQIVAGLRGHEATRDVPVLMLTAEADDDLRVRLLRAGAQDFLTRPFTAAELLARAENLIQINRTREMLREELKSRSGDLTALAREVAARRREMQSALDALGRSNQTLEAIIEASPLAIVTLDERAVVRSWNPAAERTFGWTEDEIVGRPLPTVPEELSDEVARNHAAAVSGRSFANFETVRRRKDGTLINVSISTAPLLDEEGRPRGVVALVADITERKRAEDAIRFQAHLLDTVEQAVIATDTDGTINYWNRFAERMYGWRAAEVIGRNVVEVTPAETTREQADEIMSSLRRGESWTGEFTVRRRDGTVFPVTVTDTPINDGGGRMIGIVGVSRDISQRKRAEGERTRLAAQIEGERRRLKELVGNVPGVVWEAWGEPDASSQRINFVSDYVETMLGYTVEEWLATPNFWLTIVHPEDRERAAAEARAKFDSRKGGATQFRWVRKDGRAIHVEAQSLIVCDDAGRPVGMRGVTMDITERKRAEAALRASEEKYRTLFDSMDEGFCILQVIFDDERRPVDYRFVETNPAFERQTGIKGGLGRTAREAVPRLEPFWFDVYGRVALTGEPVRFENSSEPMGRWFDVYAFRVGEPEERRVAVLFKDITERRRRETNLTFLAEIGSDLSRLSSPDEIMRTVGAKLGAYLKITTCNFNDVDEARGEIGVQYSWNDEGVPSLRRTFRTADYLTGEFIRASRAGETIIIRDVRADPRTEADNYAALKIGAFVAVPFHRGGEWRQFLSVSDSRPRDWRGDEIELIQEVAARIFTRLERARSEAALRESEERFRSLADSVPVLIWLNGIEGCEFVNRQYLDFLGRSLEDVLKMDWATALHPDDAEEYVAAYLKAFEARAPFSAQFRFRRADGEYRWLRSDGLPRFTPDGTFVGYVGSSFDVTDMRLAEEAVRASERRFRALVDQSPFSTQIFSPDGRTVRVNPAWEKLWGVKLSDLDAIGYNILEDRQLEERGILDPVRRAFAGEATPLPPIPYDPPSGVFAGLPRWVQAFIYPVKDERGEVREVVLVHEDVSVRMRAEEALRESQARLEGIVESAMDAIVTVDEEQQVVLFNRAAEQMFGRRAVEAVGLPLEEFMPERFRGDHREYVRAFGRTGVTTRAMAGARAVAGLRADGSEFPLEASISQIEAGGRKLYTVIMRDITERQRAEEEQKFLSDATTALASSLDYEATLGAVAELAADFLADYCLVDLVEDDGRVRRLVAAHRDPARAAAWREMQARFPVGGDSDHTVARVLRTGAAELFPEMDGDALARVTPDAGHAAELRRLGLRSAMTVPLVARGRILGALTFVSAEPNRAYGARELRLAEELARRVGLAVDNARLYQRAQEANRAKDEFLATLSHELRTPLTPIIGWVHLMSDGGIRPEDLTHGLSVIDKNSQSLSRLIADLLDMSAILNNKMRIERAPVALESVIRQAAETVRPQAEMRNVSMEFESCGDARLEVSGDRTRLAQVFWNLLTNAVKFSAEGGRVRVRCEREGRVARVHVDDEGVGIAPEFLPRVFDRFQQADMSTTKQYGGLGIGLALVRSFVEAHGGTVTAASPGANRGSRFTVSLPLSGDAATRGRGDAGTQREAAPPEIPPAPSSDVAVSPRPHVAASQPPAGRVLVVEDAADTLEMMRVLLAACGYEVVACRSATEALGVAARGHFDIIVSDIGLPDTDGYELLRRIRREAPHLARVPALAVTGYAAERDVELAREAGYAAHVAKPFEPHELAEHIALLLGRDEAGGAH